MNHLIPPFAALMAALMLAGSLTTGCKGREPIPGNGTDGPATNQPANTGISAEREQALLRRISALEAERDQLNSQLRTARSDNETLENRNSDLAERADGLESQLDARDDEIADLNNRIEQLNRQIERLRDQAGGIPTAGGEIEPAPLGPERGRIPSGFARFEAEAGFGFDYPEGWDVRRGYSLDGPIYTLLSPAAVADPTKGTTVEIQVWPFDHGDPEQLVRDAMDTAIRELVNDELAPTTEEDVRLIDDGIAGAESYRAQIFFERESVSVRRRFVAARMAVGDEGERADYSFLVVLQYNAADETVPPMFDTLLGTFWIG